MNFNKIKGNHISELLFLTSYALYIIQRMINNTTLGDVMPFALKRGMKIGIIALIICSIIVQKKLNKEWTIKALCIILFSFIVTIISGDLNLICLMLLIIASAYIEFDKIIKICLWTNIFMLFVVVLFCFAGILLDNITSHYSIILKTQTQVHAYGFLHYSMPAYMIFYISLLILYFKHSNLIYIILGIVNLFSYLIFTTKLPFFLYFIFVLIILILKNKTNAKLMKLLTNVLYFSIPILFSLIVFLSSAFYNSKNKIIFLFNNILSDRIRQGYMGIQKFGLSLFGNDFEMVGIDTLRRKGLSINNYIYVDSDLLYIPMKYGIIFFILIIILYTLLIKVFIDKKEIYFLAYTITVLIFATINWCLINVEINPALFLAIKIIALKNNFDNMLK